MEEITLEKERRHSAISLYHCGWESCTPEHSFGPAQRDHYLFHFILKGRGIFVNELGKYELNAGEGFLIQPQERTFYQADKEDPWEYVWIGFSGYEAKRLLTDCGLNEKKPIYYAKDPFALSREMLNLVDLFRQPVGSYALLSQFYRVASLMEHPHAQLTGSNYVEYAVQYIQRNYSYHISVAELASKIGIDRTYLYKLFCKEVGSSPQEYLILCRIEAAKELLISSRLPAAEIACSCGFKDAPSFYKQFQRIQHQTPIQYRREYAKKSTDLDNNSNI